MDPNSNVYPVNRDNLLSPWENKEFFNSLKNNDNLLSCSLDDQSFNGYYYMVTIKNNTSPKKQYTHPDRYCHQAGRLLAMKFHIMKSAFELDSKDQLHLHLVCRREKDCHRVKTSQALKKWEPTFCHDIKPITTEYHLTNALDYLDPRQNQLVLKKYQYEWFPNDACDFIDTTVDTIKDHYTACKAGLVKF